MKITAQDLQKLGIVDRIVPEPTGGAHRDRAAAVSALGAVLGEELDALAAFDATGVRRLRRDKFLAIG
jgi:acetyl-CoA carboxylase carboxyl transferase subunit alpha